MTFPAIRFHSGLLIFLSLVDAFSETKDNTIRNCIIQMKYPTISIQILLHFFPRQLFVPCQKFKITGITVGRV